MINDVLPKEKSFFAEYYKEAARLQNEQESNNSRDQERQVQGCVCDRAIKVDLPDAKGSGAGG